MSFGINKTGATPKAGSVHLDFAAMIQISHLESRKCRPMGRCEAEDAKAKRVQVDSCGKHSNKSLRVNDIQADWTLRSRRRQSQNDRTGLAHRGAVRFTPLHRGPARNRCLWAAKTAESWRYGARLASRVRQRSSPGMSAYIAVCRHPPHPPSPKPRGNLESIR
jgi:hypothetical protein